VEDANVKRDIFFQLDELTTAILATNTSSIPITAIAAVTRHPHRVIGMHFFNPPHVMKLVEVVPGLDTSAGTVEETCELARVLGRTPIVVRRDIPGFIVNRILMAQFIEAARLVEEGVASPAEIDEAVRLGLGYPMGPFELQDFVGLDVVLSVMDVLFNEYRDPRYAAPPSLRTLVRARHLGRKSGSGWSSWKQQDA